MRKRTHELGPCPACGAHAGELKTARGTNFPYRVQCAECGWRTGSTGLAAVAVRIWNEAKPQDT
jgi:hypothetical protein